MTEFMAPALRARLASVGANTQIFSGALITHPEAVHLGDHSRIDDYVRIEGGKGVSIGDYVHLASFSSILGGGEFQMGAYGGLAQGARVVTGTGHPLLLGAPAELQPPEDDVLAMSRGRVVLGDWVLVGVNAVVLQDVTLGDGAVVAAGAVVTQDVDPWTIVAGVPARPVASRPPISSPLRRPNETYD